VRSPLNREGVSLTVCPAEMAGKMASWLHGAALDWAWNYLVLPRYENALVIVTEQDVFLSAPFSPTRALAPAESEASPVAQTCSTEAPCSMAGHVQRRFNEDGLGPFLSKFACSNACREMNLGRESACAGGRRCICTPRLSSSTSLRSRFRRCCRSRPRETLMVFSQARLGAQCNQSDLTLSARPGRHRAGHRRQSSCLLRGGPSKRGRHTTRRRERWTLPSRLHSSSRILLSRNWPRSCVAKPPWRQGPWACG